MLDCWTQCADSYRGAQLPPALDHQGDEEAENERHDGGQVPNLLTATHPS